jgi:hypothetical protein
MKIRLTELIPENIDNGLGVECKESHGYIDCNEKFHSEKYPSLGRKGVKNNLNHTFTLSKRYLRKKRKTREQIQEESLRYNFLRRSEYGGNIYINGRTLDIHS